MKFILSSQNVLPYLSQRGICQSESSILAIEQKPGKNFNLLLTLPEERQLLVKQEVHNLSGETLGEFEREWRIQRFCQKFPQMSGLSPWLPDGVSYDEDNSILVFNYLKGYHDLRFFYNVENHYPTSIAAAIGWILATIHRLTLNNQEYQQFFAETKLKVSKGDKPDLCNDLQRITPKVFATVPDEGLKFFAFYQKYDSLEQAIASLREAFTPCCLTHNDLSLSNILLLENWSQAAQGQNIVRIIDWERSLWGDPAFDLGILVGHYLEIWLRSLVTSTGMTMEESLRLATIPLESLQPSIAALAVSYFSNFPEILEHRRDFWLRVVQFAGLGLIRSIQATIQHAKSFGNSGICMLQVAKALICRPEQSMSTVFSTAATELVQHNLSVSRV